MKKLIVLLLISLSTAAFANKGVEPSSLTNPIVVQKALDSGVVFTSNQVQYQLILGGRAVNQNTNNITSLAALSVSSNNNYLWSDKKGPFQVFITSEASNASLAAMSSSASSYNQIAYNPETGNVAIIVGEIIVKLRPNVSAEVIAAIYNINLVNNFQQINTAIYRVNDWQDIFTISKQLSENPAIEYAEVDVIEHFAQPL